MFNSNYNPLQGTGISNADSLLRKIMSLREELKIRGEK